MLSAETDRLSAKPVPYQIPDQETSTLETIMRILSEEQGGQENSNTKVGGGIVPRRGCGSQRLKPKFEYAAQKMEVREINLRVLGHAEEGHIRNGGPTRRSHRSMRGSFDDEILSMEIDQWGLNIPLRRVIA